MKVCSHIYFLYPSNNNINKNNKNKINMFKITAFGYFMMTKVAAELNDEVGLWNKGFCTLWNTLNATEAGGIYIPWSH